MKRITTIILAVLVGGAVTTAVFYACNTPGGTAGDAEIHYTDKMVRSTGLTYDEREQGTMSFPDFTSASRKVMDAVVHIQTSQTVRGAGRVPQEQLPEPFRDFFERFYGPGGPEQEAPQRRRRGAGSGVILNESGHIVTNNHVIANADEIIVTLHNNETYNATVLGADPSTDLALVKIDAGGLPFIPLVNSDSLLVGEWVLAIGNPFNLTSTVTAGIVSAKARNINIMREQYAIESFIQTDAAINPGNSGGALVSLGGGLVGINTAIASPTGAYSGYGFAVPSNIVGKVVEDIIEFGVVQRGYLGVIIRNVDGELARQENLDVTEGVFIDSVLENSAADKAGIRVGDVITSIDGTETDRSAQLQELVARHRPGEEVEIGLIRKGRTMETSATLQSREGTTETVTRERGKVLGRLGAAFEDITNRTARELGIDGGVRVTELHAGVLSQQTDMREGFIITRVNNQPVDSVVELVSMLEDHRGGVMLEGVYEDVTGTFYYAFGL